MAYASAVISLIKELVDKRNKHGAAKAVLNTNAAAKARAQRGSLRPLCATAFLLAPDLQRKAKAAVKTESSDDGSGSDDDKKASKPVHKKAKGMK